MSNFCIAVHGGAGTISKKKLNAELEKKYNAALYEALSAGYTVLSAGGSAIDSVEAAVMQLENFELFNAGRGSVFTHIGTHEMDAAIMDGKNLNAGAAAGIKHVKNPVMLAKQILLKSDHILLIGEGAETFAMQQNIPFEGDEYFYSSHRFEQLQNALRNDNIELDHHDENKYGTVGAVALDGRGNLAAATSTGGMTNKSFGRVGDTPLVGCGTYANNKTCAVSCTGHGEFFIKHVVAYDISCLMEYKNLSLTEASEFVVNQKLKYAGGEGGLIAVDSSGNICLPFNTEGMYRGWMKNRNDYYTGIFMQ